MVAPNVNGGDNMTLYDAEQYKIKKYQKITEEMIKEDATIICYGQTVMTDCNDNVSASSIALRELVTYSNIDKNIKDKIYSILTNYGMMFENEYERVFDVLYEIKLLLGDKIAIQVGEMKTNNYLFDEIDIMEKIIDKVLLKYWQEYTIPTEKYNQIVYINDKNNIKMTYKDVKRVIFQARDSGGNIDCFGFANQNTMMNCIKAFVNEKVKITNEKEFEQICEDIYDTIIEYQDFDIEIY